MKVKSIEINGATYELSGSSFEDARNFEEENLENIELKDGDLFYVEQKEEFKETPDHESATLIEISPELEEQPYRNIIKLDGNSNYTGLNEEEVFPYTDMNFDITEDFLRDRMRLWKWDESYTDEEGYYKPYIAVGIFLLPNNIELPFSEDEFSSDEYKVYTKEQINEYSKAIPTFTLSETFGGYIMKHVYPHILHDNVIYVTIDSDNETFINFSTPIINKYSNMEYEYSVYINYVPILKSYYDKFNTFNYNDNTFIISGSTERIDYDYITISEETNKIETLYSNISGVITYDSDFFNCNRGFLSHGNHFYKYDSNNPLLSYSLLKEVEYLLSFIKYYHYYAPIKQYIMYSQGRFYTLGDKDQQSLINKKTLLKIIEAIEESENEDFSLTLTTFELFQMFNIKVISEQYILEPVNDNDGFLYMTKIPAFNMKFIDREHVKIWIYGNSGSGSGSGSGGDSSSQELYIGEFEE